MSDVASNPPIMMRQFEVIPTRRGWRLVEWVYDPFDRFSPRHIKYMAWPPLRSMSNLSPTP